MKLISKIEPEYSIHKRWLIQEDKYFSGSVFLDNKLLSEDDIMVALTDINSIDQAVRFTEKLNGHFAIALQIQDSIFLATDRERTIPIFYEINNDCVYIYNHISLGVIKTHGININAYKELNHCLFVSGNKNMACNVFSVMAGEYVTIENGVINRMYYHELVSGKKSISDKQVLFSLMDELFCEVIKRLIIYLNGRSVVIPLSGGHDSRLLAYYLKKLGYKSIITYTYGPKGNIESATSENVAKFLGLKWHNIVYDPKTLQAFFKDNFRDIVDYYFNGVSSVCVQDWYAFDYLVKNELIPKDSVIVPGHSFDFLAGNHILPRYVNNPNITKKELIDDILWKHYSEGKRKLSQDSYEYLSKNIADELLKGQPEIMDSDVACDYYHNFNLRERQAKFICNQVKLYEYYGYDWFLPLWDSKLTDFWNSIDIKSRFNRKIFFEFTQYEYKDLMEVAPVLDEKLKIKKKVNMNPIVRVVRKISQLINYVDYHYCLAYFTRGDVLSIYLSSGVLNIGFFVNRKIQDILRREIN